MIYISIYIYTYMCMAVRFIVTQCSIVIVPRNAEGDLLFIVVFLPHRCRFRSKAAAFKSIMLTQVGSTSVSIFALIGHGRVQGVCQM